MQTDVLAKIDTYVFRFLGLFIGIGGCVALLVNNPVEEVFRNTYGLIFFFIFLALWLYSLASFANEILHARTGETKRPNPSGADRE